jgi:hypothetical protein
MTHIPWDRVWYDPHSRSLDFSDARYKGMVIWTDRDSLEEMYPDADDVIESSFSSTDFYYNDRPETAFWTDNNRRRVRLVQCDWSERGTWWRATYTKSGLLAKPQRSKFKDRKGKSCSGLLLQSSYINRENQRYGMVRGLISLQDEINKRRSKAMHLLNVHQVVAEQGAVPDVDKARRLRRSDAGAEVRDPANHRLGCRPVPAAAARHRRDAALRPQRGYVRHRSARAVRPRCVGDASGGRSAERAAGRRAAVLEQAGLRSGLASS